MIVEACVETLGQALAAEAGGADRIELCTNLAADGTTPPDALIAATVAHMRLPVFVMVRPRAGAFVYAADEVEVMRQQVLQARRLGARGIATGALDGAGRVDQAVVAELVAAAHPLPVTFHRAFDRVVDQLAALETLVALGVSRVLSSGGAATAVRGADGLAALVRAAGDRIVVMAGGGIRAHNVRQIVERSGVREVHGRFGTTDEVRAVVRASAA